MSTGGQPQKIVSGAGLESKIQAKEVKVEFTENSVEVNFALYAKYY